MTPITCRSSARGGDGWRHTLSYIRLTVATPPPERLAEVREQYQEIIAYVSTFPGYEFGWVVAPGYGDGEVGRLTIWQSEAAANSAATDPHAMALHARVRFTAAGNLWDRSFDTDISRAPTSTTVDDLDTVAVLRAVEALYWRRR